MAWVSRIPMSFRLADAHESVVSGREFAHNLQEPVSRPSHLRHAPDGGRYGRKREKHQFNRLRTLTFGGRQEEALRDSIAWAKEPCDCLVHTGDLIDWQSEANFALVKFSPTAMEYVVVGNFMFQGREILFS